MGLLIHCCSLGLTLLRRSQQLKEVGLHLWLEGFKWLHLLQELSLILLKLLDPLFPLFLRSLVLLLLCLHELFDFLYAKRSALLDLLILAFQSGKSTAQRFYFSIDGLHLFFLQAAFFIGLHLVPVELEQGQPDDNTVEDYFEKEIDSFLESHFIPCDKISY